MPSLPQARDGHYSDIKVGAYTCLSPQSLEGRKSVILLDSRLSRFPDYKPDKDPFFMETLKLCDKVFYPLRERFLSKLWRRAFGSIYKVDFERGLIAFDIPITSYHNRMSYSRIVIIPRGFILDSKEVEALWLAAFSIPKPIDGRLDSITVAVFAQKAGDKLPNYRFERLGKQSKMEFMAFVGLPAKSMAEFLKILIQFLEKRLMAFLRRFDIPLRGLAYSLGERGSYIRTKRPKPDLRSFLKWRPSRVDYIKSVKSLWLRNALKGLMSLINELIDAYRHTVIPLIKIQLGLRSLRKILPQIIGQLFGNLRFTPEGIKQLIEMVLSEDVRPKTLDALFKLINLRDYHRRPNLAASEAARG